MAARGPSLFEGDLLRERSLIFISEDMKNIKEVVDLLHLLANKLDDVQVVLEIKAEEEPKKRVVKHSLEIEIE